MTQPVEYKSTLNLPKTAFAMKADLPKREPEMLARWDQTRLYERIQAARKGRPSFVLHDGPPYANGDIHIGHALNKIMKDIIVRYKTLREFRAPYVPGWDCHGMPIEHQLLKERKITKHQISQTEFRKLAREYAQRFVGIQRDQFKRLAVMGDWEHPYLTMAPEYELTIVRTFYELVKQGYVYHGKKPVYWCATCETALAEAEVEYEDRQDASIYLRFPIVAFGTDVAVPTGLIKEGLAVAVWTTTPWTLPANVALCFHPAAEYVAISSSAWGTPVLVASALADRFAQVSGGASIKELWRGSGRLLGGLKAKAPFRDVLSVGVLDDSVSMEEGTGVVHIAPGHGHEDYLIGQQNKLDVLSPVDHQGKFTKDVPQFAGQSVFDANPKIIADLKSRGLLLKEAPVTHSYPHCWRCKQPVIFRATPQWFLSVEHQGLRARLLKVAKEVSWVPEFGLNRMSGMLDTRPDWCLSRQRYWGTPIPVLSCEQCHEPLLDPKILDQIEQALAARGTEMWFEASPSELAPGASCPTCHGTAMRKETDILDVWFDSGVSHEAVLKARAELAWPANLYLEGSDQHRGWFQVSLIPSVALHGRPPYRQVLTHGFVVDGEGRKMSKSLGNVIAPQEILQHYGAEILRLWVAASDYREDVRISEAIIGQMAEAYRKIRNTFRYLLANLYDFSPERDGQPLERCPEIDRWALQRAQQIVDEAAAAYDTYQFHQVFRAAYDFCVTDLSSFYLDVLKDRLYTEAPDSSNRRCAQTTLYGILGALVRVFAPMLPVTMDDVWQHMRQTGLAQDDSVHLALWPERLVDRMDAQLAERWQRFLAIRDAAMKALEVQRAQGVIGSPLEAHVTLLIGDPALARVCAEHQQALAEAFVVSAVDVMADGAVGAEPTGVEGLRGVRVQRAQGQKCQRCWKYRPEVGARAEHPQLCERCWTVVTHGH